MGTAGQIARFVVIDLSRYTRGKKGGRDRTCEIDAFSLTVEMQQDRDGGVPPRFEDKLVDFVLAAWVTPTTDQNGNCKEREYQSYGVSVRGFEKVSEAKDVGEQERHPLYQTHRRYPKL